MTPKRREIAPQDRWNVEALYPSYNLWESEFDALWSPPEGQTRFAPLLAYRGQIAQGASFLAQALREYFRTLRLIEKLMVYAHLRHDEDLTEEQAKGCYERSQGLLQDFRQATSWLDPEILALPPSKLQEMLASEELAEFRFHLEKLCRMQKHTLSPTEEKLSALSSMPLQTAYKAFSALNNADLKFPSIRDSQDQERSLSHGSYRLYLHDRDRTLRENAFKTYQGQFLDYENTLGELLAGNVQAHLFEAKARHYSSCMEASLKPHNIPVEVYHSLIAAVRDNISALHRYIDLKRRLLQLPQLHAYDLYAPVTTDFEIKVGYEEAEEMVIASAAPLGSHYQEILRRGLIEERWVDRYENSNKRSGAYSSGCFDSHPYILMNFKGLLNDAFTLAHEAGHSMHSYYSRHQQPYHYADYPIFVAEVASTFNEELLMHQMLKNVDNPQAKIYLIAQKLDDIYATLFRQTLFAEFEALIHEYAEKSVPLTPTLLKEEFQKLTQAYFGPSFMNDPLLAIEWARVPHFYYNFYVYQYATGISAGLALAKSVIEGGNRERDAYLQFLQGGCSRYPIELLQTAGVDMRSKKPVEVAIQTFANLLNELESLTLGRTAAAAQPID